MSCLEDANNGEIGSNPSRTSKHTAPFRRHRERIFEMATSTNNRLRIKPVLLARQSQKKLPNRYVQRRMLRNRSVKYDRTLTRHGKQLPQPASSNGLASQTPKLENTELPYICWPKCKAPTGSNEDSFADRPQLKW